MQCVCTLSQAAVHEDSICPSYQDILDNPATARLLHQAFPDAAPKPLLSSHGLPASYAATLRGFGVFFLLLAASILVVALFSRVSLPIAVILTLIPAILGASFAQMPAAFQTSGIDVYSDHVEGLSCVGFLVYRRQSFRLYYDQLTDVHPEQQQALTLLVLSDGSQTYRVPLAQHCDAIRNEIVSRARRTHR